MTGEIKPDSVLATHEGLALLLTAAEGQGGETVKRRVQQFRDILGQRTTIELQGKGSTGLKQLCEIAEALPETEAIAHLCYALMRGETAENGSAPATAAPTPAGSSALSPSRTPAVPSSPPSSAPPAPKRSPEELQGAASQLLEEARELPAFEKIRHIGILRALTRRFFADESVTPDISKVLINLATIAPEGSREQQWVEEMRKIFKV